MKSSIFSKKSIIDASVEEVFQWHARAGAIERLSPPWDPLKVVGRSGGIKTGAKVDMRMKVGPISFPWLAEHTAYEENRLFRDEQRKGPFAKWIHTHGFHESGEGKCLLEDQIEYALPLHFLSHPVFGRTIRKKLSAIFAYRHRVTQQEIALHRMNQDKESLNILISGAGGLLGTELTSFFTTGGLRVIRLVRNRSAADADEIAWNPDSGLLDLESTERIDAVIHLAGENIGDQPWTDKKKQRILDSRVKSARLLADKISQLKTPPRVFLSASAIGYYGNRGDEILTEQDAAGDLFISTVCSQWEESARPALDAGIRTVFLRIGVVLTPLGGVLSRLSPPFKLGIGMKFASGKQYVSWISMADVLGAINHSIFSSKVSGAVNLTAPNPVTNLELSKTLGRVLRRPVPFTMPAFLIKALFGGMGKETLLSSARVHPQALLDSGYRFIYPDLESWLTDVLGKSF